MYFVGVGCTKRESDNWFAHKDDYAELLAQLNEAHNASGNLSVDSDSSAAVCAVAKKPIYSKISKNSMRREQSVQLYSFIIFARFTKFLVKMLHRLS